MDVCQDTRRLRSDNLPRTQAETNGDYSDVTESTCRLMGLTEREEVRAMSNLALEFPKVDLEFLSSCI